MTRLAARQIGFSFASDAILHDVNFVCRGGEFMSILGASGSGKSTLLRLVAGLLQPGAGRIVLDEQNGDARARAIGFVFQQPTLCPWRDVRRNVELPLQLAGHPAGQRRGAALDAIELVGLTRDDQAKLPRQLSGGMRMRVSLARALVTRPRVMLLDEPFAAVDEVLRQQLCETYLQLWRQERWTTLLVTHNVAEAVFMSQQILILAGRPAKIVDHIDVPFGERTAPLRTTAEFAQAVADVSQRLRQAVESN